MTTWVGSGVPRFFLPLDQIFPQTNVSQMIVLPQDMKARETLRKQLPALLADEFPEVRGRAKLLPNGPPVPYPVQFRVVGPDAAQVRAWADEVEGDHARQPEHARRQRQLERVGQGAAPGQSTRTRRARSASPARRIAQAARTSTAATTIGQYREGDKLIDIVLRQPRRRARRDHRPGQRLRADRQRHERSR